MVTNNHYGTLVNANVFFDNRLHTFDWQNAIVDDRIKAMNQATQLIDQFEYLGQKYTVSILAEDATDEQIRTAQLAQEREFPRGTVNQVPIEIEEACYLIAKALLSGRDPEADLENLAVKSSAYGGVKTSYARDGNLQEHLTHLIPSPEAFFKLRPFMRERNVFKITRV